MSATTLFSSADSEGCCLVKAVKELRKSRAGWLAGTCLFDTLDATSVVAAPLALTSWAIWATAASPDRRAFMPVGAHKGIHASSTSNRPHWNHRGRAVGLAGPVVVVQRTHARDAEGAALSKLAALAAVGANATFSRRKNTGPMVTLHRLGHALDPMARILTPRTAHWTVASPTVENCGCVVTDKVTQAEKTKFSLEVPLIFRAHWSDGYRGTVGNFGGGAQRHQRRRGRRCKFAWFRWGESASGGTFPVEAASTVTKAAMATEPSVETKQLLPSMQA